MNQYNYKISHAYATAICEISSESNSEQLYWEIFNDWKRIISENKEFISILFDFNIEQNKREDLLKSTLLTDDRIPKDLHNWTLLILQREKFNKFDEIIKECLKLLNNKLNRVEGIIYSTQKIDNEQLKQIVAKCEEKLSKKVILQNVIKPELISGYEIIIGDYRFSNNVVSWLEQMKNKLLKR